MESLQQKYKRKDKKKGKSEKYQNNMNHNDIATKEIWTNTASSASGSQISGDPGINFCNQQGSINKELSPNEASALPSVNSTKRFSATENCGISLPKKSRTSDATHELCDEILKDPRTDIVMAVIDERHPDGSVEPSLWPKVESDLNCGFLKVLEETPGPMPMYRDGGWRGDIKLVVCQNQRSVDVYRYALRKNRHLWPNVSLKMVHLDQIPCRPKVRLMLPRSMGESDILTIIRRCNPDLPTANWRILNMNETQGEQRYVTIGINRESLPRLDSTKGFVNFGFSSVRLELAEMNNQTPMPSRSSHDDRSKQHKYFY